MGMECCGKKYRAGGHGSTKAFGTSRWGTMNYHLMSENPFSSLELSTLYWVQCNLSKNKCCIYTSIVLFVCYPAYMSKIIQAFCTMVFCIYKTVVCTLEYVVFVQRLVSEPVYWSVPTPRTSYSKLFTARRRTSYPLRTPWCWPTTSSESSHRKVST